MNTLTPPEQAFIHTHLTDDPAALLLRKGIPSDLRAKVVAAQLVARQKARTKLPTWYAHPDVVFPPALSVEQASSERTAAYKAEILARSSRPDGPPPNLLIDLTGGMGVDALAFAQQAQQVIYVEQQPELAELAAHNLPVLGGTNVRFEHQNGIDFLRSFPGRADWIYLDPARRDDRGGKVVRLEDCEPALADYASILEKADWVLLKTSPLIDLEDSLRQLPGMCAIHVVSVDNDCKEVLFVLGAPAEDGIPVTTVNLRTHHPDEVFTFRRSEERQVDVPFSEPLRYLYEPNASVLKAGGFRSVAAGFGVQKLAPHSHLYTSEELRNDFPGRAFEVLGSCPPDRKALSAFLDTLDGYPAGKANLTVRNFPETADKLRKKLGLADGGDLYVFATTLFDGKKRILITRKANHLSLST